MGTPTARCANRALATAPSGARTTARTGGLATPTLASPTATTRPGATWTHTAGAGTRASRPTTAGATTRNRATSAARPTTTARAPPTATKYSGGPKAVVSRCQPHLVCACIRDILLAGNR